MPHPSQTIVVAMTRQRVIGREGRMPWHLPDELRLFRRLTWGGTLILGRRTHAAIGRPLPGRHTLVVSRTLPSAAGVEICRSFADALARAREIGRPIFFAGGADIYRAALPVADSLHISWIHREYAGDTFFPDFGERAWRLERSEDFAGFTHCVYRRREPSSCTSAEKG